MPTNQFIFIACGILFVVLTIKHAIVGRRSAYWGGMVHRETAPKSFWFTIALDPCIAVAFLVYAIMHVPR